MPTIPYEPTDWTNTPDTPLSDEGLIAGEQRVAAYAQALADAVEAQSAQALEDAETAMKAYADGVVSDSENSTLAEVAAAEQRAKDHADSLVRDDVLSDTVLEEKGDLIVASGAADPDRLPLGDPGQVLTPNQEEDLGVEWVTPALPLVPEAQPPIVSGPRDNNQALTSLLIVLAELGLIDDQTIPDDTEPE